MATLSGVGVKHDGGKRRYDLLPMDSVDALVDIITFGCDKYGPNNWQNLENGSLRYYAAAMRHLSAWRQGEELDQESGLPHLAHAMCCLTFMLHLEKKG